MGGHFDWLARFNWGHGMIGKITLALIVLVGAPISIAVARVSNELMMAGLVATGVVAFFAYFGITLLWASKNPNLAATEGPTYVESKQIDVAAKGMLPSSASPLSPDPQNPTLIE
jgi:hypothetical protein